jgi:predicted DNA-binding protein
MAKATKSRSDTLIGFRVRAELKEKLAELAGQDHRPLSGYIVHLLEMHVAEMVDVNQKRSAKLKRDEEKPPRR